MPIYNACVVPQRVDNVSISRAVIAHNTFLRSGYTHYVLKLHAHHSHSTQGRHDDLITFPASRYASESDCRKGLFW